MGNEDELRFKLLLWLVALLFLLPVLGYAFISSYFMLKLIGGDCGM